MFDKIRWLDPWLKYILSQLSDISLPGMQNDALKDDLPMAWSLTNWDLSTDRIWMTSGFLSDSSCPSPIVGIFAIQGAVLEHADCIRKCGGTVKEVLSLIPVTHPQIMLSDT
jgi:hypothetical protein